ncbi:ankyrin repeat domain-containing protein [Wolbachia endosymbiont (group B) of Limnophora tigrina]|uniref:ankyrin repeat domain-containing protein n=1 Tax=Wolbachia endosymbiont (group B) of Limnophora tigrina TaxID=3139317 RepID=UPI0035B5699C
MLYRNGVAYYGAYGGGDNTASQARNPTTSTKKLFKAINDGNLEDFKQALEEGANVNVFDRGYTPLMTIIMNGDDSPICLKMIMLLLQHQNLNINAQETKECNTALHLAFRMENKNFIQMLLRHPNLNVGIKNYCGINEGYTSKKYTEQIGRSQKRDFSYLTKEIQKARTGGQLLNALSCENFYEAKVLLNQEFNPNCWKRSRSEKIETPLSLIIRSCLRTITEDKKEVLTKLLKHKDLDFSYEQYAQLKQTIEQAITERLTDAINRKDLDGVKELVDDNCFMNYTIVTAALRNVNNPIESITNYLNEKFPANTNKTGKISQLERDLKQVKEERDRLSSENRWLCTESLSNKNKKPSQAISPGKKQSNYASACFILLGVYAVAPCLVIEDYPGVSAFFAAVALVLLLVGCHSLYKANTILSDVKSTQLGDLERS